jgi:hypothetical protein
MQGESVWGGRERERSRLLYSGILSTARVVPPLTRTRALSLCRQERMTPEIMEERRKASALFAAIILPVVYRASPALPLLSPSLPPSLPPSFPPSVSLSFVLSYTS